MFSSDSYLQTFLFMMRFAEAYSDGTYGSGSYNEGEQSSSTLVPTTPAPSNTSTVKTTTVSETPISSDEAQSVESTVRSPQTTTQSTSQETPATGVTYAADNDLTWTVLGAVIAGVVLVTLLIIAIKKLSQR